MAPSRGAARLAPLVPGPGAPPLPAAATAVDLAPPGPAGGGGWRGDAGAAAVGTAGGQVLEYRLAWAAAEQERGTGAVAGRLEAELAAVTEVLSGPVQGVACLGAAALAVLGGGGVHLVQPKPNSAKRKQAAVKEGAPKGCTAFTKNHSSGGPMLAVASFQAPSPGRPKKARLLLYEVQGEPGGLHLKLLQEAGLHGLSGRVGALAWFGQNIVFAMERSYHVYSVEHDAVRTIFELPPASFGGAALHVLPKTQEAVVFLDNIGTVVSAEGHPTGKTVLPSGIAVAMADLSLFTVMASSSGLSVYERDNPTPKGLIQQLPYERHSGGETTSQIVGMAGDLLDSYAVVCGGQALVAVTAVPFKEQCRALLQQGQYAEALGLVDSCGAEVGELPWKHEVVAQIGFLLLGELQFAEAMGHFLQCPEVQPAELFPLFPEFVAPWAAQVPRHEYWRLHKPLTDLASLVGEGLRAREGENEGGEAGAVEREAKHFICNYLYAVRQQREPAALAAPDGVDTLIAMLLCELGDVDMLEAFCGGEGNRIDLALLQEHLLGRGRCHTLALLWEARGELAKAADLWHQLGTGQRREGPASSGAFARAGGPEGGRRVAFDALARALKRVRGDAAAFLRFAPWMLRQDAEAALAALTAVQLPEREALEVVRAHGDLVVRWRYLHHIVRRLGTLEPAHHTELALALVEALRGGRHAADGDEGEARARLQEVLWESDLYDSAAVLEALRGADLPEERVAAHTKRAEYGAALRILAVEQNDLAAAEAYCQQHGGQQSYLQLLQLLLAPGEGRAPRYDQAVRILAAREADLDPLQLLNALPETMPLPLAAGTIERMLKERLHRKRTGQVAWGLARALESAAAIQRVAGRRQFVEVTNDTVCEVCRTRIGTKVFARYPSGTVVCYRCLRRGSPSVDPVTGADFKVV